MNKINRVIVKAVAVLVAIVGVLNIIDYIYAATSANAATSGLSMSATITPSSTVSISTNNVSLDIVPSANGTFKKSDALVVSTFTNTPNTCTVTMVASSANLASAGSNTPITPLTSAVSESDFSSQTTTKDKWGYQVDTGDFNPVVAGSNAITTKASATGNTASNNNVYFAAKLSQATKPGEYANTVTFASTCQPSGGG